MISATTLLKSLKSVFFLTGLTLALLIWIIDSLIDVVLFQDGSFYQQLMQPSIHEFYMRSTFSAIFIIFGFLGSVILDHSKRVDEALRKTERRYRSMVENSAAGIRWRKFSPGIPVDLPVKEQVKLMFQNSIIVECNDQFAKMYGYARASELVNNPNATLMKMTPELLEMIESFVTNDYVLEDVEIREFLPDGTIKHFFYNSHGTVENGKLVQTWAAIRDITELKRIEDREISLGRIVDESLNEIYIFSADSLKFLEVNKGARKNLGYSMQELSEMTALDIKPLHTAETFREIIGPLLSGKQEGAKFETIHKRKDGSSYPVEVYLQLLSYLSQPSFVAIILDITEREQAEEALRESENKYRALFEQSADATLIIENGEFVDCNQAAVEMLGYTKKSEIMTKQPAQLSLPAQADGANTEEKASKMMSIALDQGSHRFEWNHLRQNGEIFPVEVLLTRIPFGGRDILHCVWRDITERKQAEEELKKSEGKLSKIFDATLEGVGITRLSDGKFVYVNPGLTKLLKFSIEDISGVTAQDFWVDLEDRNVLIRTLEANGQVSNFETRFRAMDGEIFPAFISASVVDVDGDTCMVALINDITERKQAELKEHYAQEQLLNHQRNQTEYVQKELNRVREKLISQTRLAAVGQVAASIAHELRNPLGAVRNAAYYMNRRLIGDNPGLAKYLDIIDHEIDASDQIISNLLEMTRAKETIKKEVDLSEMFAACVERARLSDAIRCHLQFEKEPFMVNADPGQLRQVLDNLLVNAWQSIKGEGDIFIKGEHVNGMDIITVQDTGVGINTEQQARLFEPLFTTRAKGTGLGLTISRQIIEKHGGTLDYVEQDGRGALFEIRLPQVSTSDNT